MPCKDPAPKISRVWSVHAPTICMDKRYPMSRVPDCVPGLVTRRGKLSVPFSQAIHQYIFYTFFSLSHVLFPYIMPLLILHLRSTPLVYDSTGNTSRILGHFIPCQQHDAWRHKPVSHTCNAEAQLHSCRHLRLFLTVQDTNNKDACTLDTTADPGQRGSV